MSDDPRDDDDRLCELALDAAHCAGSGACRFAEVRQVTRRREVVSLRNATLEGAFDQTDRGIGIRALVGDAWGYAATSALDPDAIAACARQAVGAAHAIAQASRRAGLSLHEPQLPTQTLVARYETPLEIDPFTLEPAQRLEPFVAAHAVLRRDDRVRVARGSFLAQRTRTRFAASHGTRLDQTITLCGGGISALAEYDGVVQVRSAPKGMEGNVLQAGFEAVLELDLPAEAHRVRAEAIALTMAPPLPDDLGPTTVVIDGDQLSLQIHESVGHPTELDRALGEEVSLAGASFLVPQLRAQGYRFGAPGVNLVADSTTPRGPGTYGFDDEGTPARRVDLVRDGRLVDFLSGRDSAARIGAGSAACLRAASWDAVPIVRMVNVNLEPGQGSRDDLISGVDRGLLLSTNRSWSIDDLRLNFQFGCEIAYEIRGGRCTGRLFRDPVYRGVTPHFWQRCSAIAGPEAWRMWGWMFCGKGDPMQLIHVGHGCAPARFDAVEVGPPGARR